MSQLPQAPFFLKKMISFEKVCFFFKKSTFLEKTTFLGRVPAAAGAFFLEKKKISFGKVSFFLKKTIFLENTTFSWNARNETFQIVETLETKRSKRPITKRKRNETNRGITGIIAS